MENIKGWILGICAAAILCSFLDILFPKGKMEKSAKLVVSLFFLCAMILPVVSEWKNLTWEDFVTQAGNPTSWEDLNATVEDQVLLLSKDSLEQAIEETLQEQNIFAEKISVNVNIDENGYITIERTDIYLAERDASFVPMVRDIIKQQMGMETNVFVGGNLS